MNTTLVDNLVQFLQRLSMAQRLALGGVLVGTVALLAAVTFWVNQQDYALLFRNLDSRDASRVVESLNADNISYQLRDEGTAIYVPRSRMHELRLRFAGEGMIAHGNTGYELFDESTLGMTDFMQKLNRKRALEGELARTIANIRQVELARVHLVMPERSPFRDAQARPTASVVVQLRNGGGLSRSQVRGITALVAGAVEGMSADEVTVLDTSGNLISDPDAGDADAVLTSNQLRLQQSVENHLAEKGQSMLDQVLGRGNAIVRVSASLDFSRSVEERELIDPESSTIISEEQLEEEGLEGEAARSAIRNYELSRTRERLERGVGGVENLTVSVVLNHRRDPMQAVNAGADGEEMPEYIPYEAQQLEEIEALVKNAVGFDPDRGDRFTIQQTRFDTSMEEVLGIQGGPAGGHDLQLYLRYGLMLLALALAAWFLRSALSRLGDLDAPLLVEQQPAPALQQPSNEQPRQAPSPEETEQVAMIEDKYQSKLSPEAKARLKAKGDLFREIKEQVEKDPDDTADLIRSWLAEDANNGHGMPA